MKKYFAILKPKEYPDVIVKFEAENIVEAKKKAQEKADKYNLDVEEVKID